MYFLAENKIFEMLSQSKGHHPEIIDSILEKALEKKGLNLEEIAFLLNADGDEFFEKLFQAAKLVKQQIYGNRLVLFAPLYISDYCVNNCRYCAFHTDNKSERKKLSINEIVEQTKILEEMGHKRLLLEFGEDSGHNPIGYVAETIEAIYGAKSGRGEIRRVNVNIAATTVENYRILKKAQIGTYQLFQETYHEETYKKIHQGPKADYNRQITAHERAFEAGLDDFGMGVLFGLYDYKFEALSLIAHAQHLEKILGVGPHTISVPRFNSADSVNFESAHKVADRDFLKIIAIIRLAVPYAGMIISTRETPEIRRQAFQIGISQTSAGSKTSPGGYKRGEDKKSLEQFEIHDGRCLDEVVVDICRLGYLPSFCTACYRSSRTGERFMELAKAGKINELCQPNALLTFREYLLDYASDSTRKIGEELIKIEIDKIGDAHTREIINKKMADIIFGQRDCYI